ncbi:putative beta-N-acetylhexosaminidase [Penicillium oxalicum 114-2]|uniref:Putative beta-N-acetylhexosaminidase n=1 Tax=Penicillium oxalicum (strain 114-2 / CGMCC 5302) TaxID=933388 RepID=S8AUP8_PENO1|nr:putative beta-N-acetylhexosaminidase [Penicillium oxalicum 114-2]
MDLQKQVGQLFVVGFHGYTPSPEIKTLIHDFHVGGIVLFSRNIKNAAQLQALTRALQLEAQSAGHAQPLFIGIDQENGLVTRISPPIIHQIPGAMALGATHDPDMAYRAGRATGELLKFFGINMNYAPVCDINSEPSNPVIGVRSPGDDPEFVGRFTSATARGLREQKIVPSVKHFPGHGETAVDSHYGLPVILKTRDQLERCELIPFRRAVAEQIEAVMTAHISLPMIDDQFPATLSPRALGILRNDMKYDGMIITDCLEMDSIRSTLGTEQGSVLALQAGSDSIMVCHTAEKQISSIRKICEEIGSGNIDSSRLADAVRRVTHVKDRFLNWDDAVRREKLEELESLNNQVLPFCKEAYDKSVTLVRDDASIIPIPRAANVVLLFPGDKTPAGGAVDGEGENRQGLYEASAFCDALRHYNSSIFKIEYEQKGLSNDEWTTITAANTVIFVSINARESPYQASMGKLITEKCRSVVAVAICNPYDFLEIPEVQTYLTTYEPTIEAFSVAADIIFGAKTSQGSLPVSLDRTNSTRSDLKVTRFVAEKDMNEVISAWEKSLPTYVVPPESLRSLIDKPNGHHHVGRIGSELAGFCLAYTSANRGPEPVHIAVLAVIPTLHGQGIGTALLTETRSYFRTQFNINQLKLGSAFPRFWPGIPRELPESVQKFFIHRGFRLSPPEARSLDLYQDIRNFQAPEKCMSRARAGGFRFAPLQPEDYEACLIGQRRNFSDKTDWVQVYVTLHPKDYPDCIMAAFDAEGKQVGWTLMLPPIPALNHVWAFPQICGPRTGLIGCVGVDASHRKSGIGLAMLCHAIENMKQRGIEGVFVDWVALDGWYEQVGFRTWRSYRPGEI